VASAASRTWHTSLIVLPPRKPALQIDGELAQLHADAVTALGRLDIAATMVPNWFLYGFVRKEVLISSQIEGTALPLPDKDARWKPTTA
jgi:hypothetical protein